MNGVSEYTDATERSPRTIVQTSVRARTLACMCGCARLVDQTRPDPYATEACRLAHRDQLLAGLHTSEPSGVHTHEIRRAA